MGEYILGLFVLLLAICGIYRVKQAVKVEERPVLCIAIEGQEAFIEGIIRYLVLRIRLLSAPERVLLLVEDSDDNTNAIVQRLAAKMLFDFHLIRDKNVQFYTSGSLDDDRIQLIDVRGQKNFVELCRTIRSLFQ